MSAIQQISPDVSKPSVPAAMARIGDVHALVAGAEKRKLLRETICKSQCTDDEFELFVETCNRRRLDPFARQIFAVWRWNPNLRRVAMEAQTSIDGFRLIAQRTSEYRGQTPPQWCGDDGAWRDVWLERSPPRAARIGVIRQGFSQPLYAVARYDTYVQLTKEGKVQSNWAKMPDLMLSKCAEALALRKAFPEDLSGLYTDDEMGHVTSSEPLRAAPSVARPALMSTSNLELIAEIRDEMEKANGLDALNRVAAKLKGIEMADHHRREMVEIYRSRAAVWAKSSGHTAASNVDTVLADSPPVQDDSPAQEDASPPNDDLGYGSDVDPDSIPY